MVAVTSCGLRPILTFHFFAMAESFGRVWKRKKVRPSNFDVLFPLLEFLHHWTAQFTITPYNTSFAYSVGC